LLEEMPLTGFALRRYTANDVAALDAAVSDSLAELVPWMPWAASEPVTRDQRLELIRQWDAQWEAGAAYMFGMRIGDQVVGGCGLHDRIGAGGLEIGYWVRSGYTSRGYATEAARALTTAAFTLPDIDRVEIHHDRANVASGRIPEKLSFIRIHEQPDEVLAPGEEGVEVVWRVTRADWSGA
jgi:ribosomal-protein-serine acetyltransferase